MQPRFTKPSTCSGCSLDRSGFGFAPPSGPLDARLRFIGESLGYEEAIHGQPFYGSAGGVLSRLCHRAGINRDAAAIGNCVSCRPPGDFLVGAPWEEHAIGCCRQYLQPVLDRVPENGVVIALGASALGSVLNLRGHAGISVKDWHGTVNRSVDDRYWVVPTFHPSHLQRGAMSLLEIVTTDLRLALKVSQSGFVRSKVDLVVDPHPDWFRQWCERYAARLAQDPEGVHLALDTEFLEKAGGADESEVVLGSTRSPITRINGADSGDLGWTVPYRQPYIGIFQELLDAIALHRGWVWLWNKYADLDHLYAAGHAIDSAQCIDAMWLWHYLQSDVPRGLGFVAPMASDFGPWKHWAKDPQKEGPYAAADGVQTWRTAMWLLKAAVRTGAWDLFLRDWHERDLYALRPAYVVGVPVNRTALETFHAELQVKLGRVLERLKETAAQGVLKPKVGYAKRPKSDVPPVSILGKPKKTAGREAIGGEAKSAYMLEGVKLVEREVEVEINICVACGAEDVGPKHRCPKPKAVSKSARRKSAGGDATVAVVPVLPERVAQLESHRRPRTRYFWQLPFNPDAPTQVLAYLDQQGIEAPIDKKRGTRTTSKKALKDLQSKHRDDPFFQLQLDWKAVQKVDSTYAVGALARMDGNDRLHPEFLPKPSTFRDSCVGVNLQNVVADKAGPDGLASGFRKCVEARDGLPPGVDAEEYAAWEARWPE